MQRTLTITYDKSDEDIPVLCVCESNYFLTTTTIIKMFTGEKAEQLYKELTGQKQKVAVSDKGE